MPVRADLCPCFRSHSKLCPILCRLRTKLCPNFGCSRARLCPISFAPCPFPNLAGTLYVKARSQPRENRHSIQEEAQQRAKFKYTPARGIAPCCRRDVPVSHNVRNIHISRHALLACPDYCLDRQHFTMRRFYQFHEHSIRILRSTQL